MRLILASGSPRRAHLLESAGLSFSQVTPDVSEDWEGLPIEDVAEALACKKAESVMKSLLQRPERTFLLSADTIVVRGSRILGKPDDREQARAMLESLSGQTHRVITGYCLLASTGENRRRTVTTEVTFKTLRPREIDYYLGTGEWSDKAGAYGIQGAAAFMVEAINGSYTNVVGLPLAQVLGDLEDMGAAPWTWSRRDHRTDSEN